MQPSAPPTVDSASPNHSVRAWHWVALAIIVAVAGSLRFVNLTRDSLCYDECFTVETIVGHNFNHLLLPSNVVLEPREADLFRHDRSAFSVWTSMDKDIHPPLYFLIMRIWADLFGYSDGSLRIPGVIASTLAIVVFFDVVRLVSGALSGLIGAVVMAIAGVQIQMAQQVRSYALVVLLSVIACDAMIRLQQNGFNWRRALTLSLSAAALMLTHYFAYGAVLALFIYAIVRFRRRLRWQVIMALGVAGVILLLLWGRSGYHQLTFSLARDDFTAEETTQPIQGMLDRLAQLPNRLLGRADEKSVVNTTAGLLMLGIPLLISIRRREAWLWAFVLIGVIAPVALSDVWRHTGRLFYVRYVIAATPAFYALLVAIGGETRWRWPIAGILIFAAASSLPYTVWSYRLETEDWRAVARRLSDLSGDSDVIVYHGGGGGLPSSRATMLCVNRYLKGHHPAMIIDHDPSSETAAALAERGHLWLVSKRASVEESFPNGRPVRTFIFPGVCTIWEVAYASPASGGSIPSAVASSIR